MGIETKEKINVKRCQKNNTWFSSEGKKLPSLIFFKFGTYYIQIVIYWMFPQYKEITSLCIQAHYWLVLQLVLPTSQLVLTILNNFEPSTRNVSFRIGHHEEPKIIFRCWLRIYWQNIHWFDIFPFSYCNIVEKIKSSIEPTSDNTSMNKMVLL